MFVYIKSYINTYAHRNSFIHTHFNSIHTIITIVAAAFWVTKKIAYSCSLHQHAALYYILKHKYIVYIIHVQV